MKRTKLLTRTNLFLAFLLAIAISYSFHLWKSKEGSNKPDSNKHSKIKLLPNQRTDPSRLGEHIKHERGNRQIEDLFELLASSQDQEFKIFLRSWLIDQSLRTNDRDLLKKAWDTNTARPDDWSRAAQIDLNFALQQISTLPTDGKTNQAWAEVISGVSKVNPVKAKDLLSHLDPSIEKNYPSLRLTIALATETIQTANRLLADEPNQQTIATAIANLACTDFEKSQKICDHLKKLSASNRQSATILSHLQAIRQEPDLAFSRMTELRKNLGEDRAYHARIIFYELCNQHLEQALDWVSNLEIGAPDRPRLFKNAAQSVYQKRGIEGLASYLNQHSTNESTAGGYLAQMVRNNPEFLTSENLNLLKELMPNDDQNRTYEWASDLMNKVQSSIKKVSPSQLLESLKNNPFEGEMRSNAPEIMIAKIRAYQMASSNLEQAFQLLRTSERATVSWAGLADPLKEKINNFGVQDRANNLVDRFLNRK